MTKSEFIKCIGNAALKYYDTYKILPSLTIAQAILESSYGVTALAEECYNYFGMKWIEGCGCGYKLYSTNEQKSDGTVYTIKARFRKYSNTSEGIKGYYDFLQYPRYKNLKDVTDYEKACNLIRQDGWATDISYTNKLLKLIKQYNLIEYDNLALNGDDEMIEAIKVNINGKDYTMNSILKDNKNYICLSDFKQAGFDIGYNSEKKIPSFGVSVVYDCFNICGTDKKVSKILKQNENYVRLRDLEDIIDINYDENNKKIIINKK